MLQARRSYGELLMSMGAVLALLVTLAAIDGRVREQVALRMGSTARASAEIAGATVQIRDLADVVYEAVRDQSVEHSTMVTFVLAGVILLSIMLRT
jgi:hypothetical protein